MVTGCAEAYNLWLFQVLGLVLAVMGRLSSCTNMQEESVEAEQRKRKSSCTPVVIT
jgi:hypothetical protein